MNSSLERARRLRIGGTYAFFIIGSIIMIFPFVWMFLTSFKTVEESNDHSSKHSAGELEI